MGLLETNVTHDAMCHGSKLGAILWKNVRGVFNLPYSNKKIAAGLLADGASDLIGFIPVVITQEMVGMTIAQFLAIESKTHKKGSKASEDQKKFINFVISKGGRAGTARDNYEVEKIIRN